MSDRMQIRPVGPPSTAGLEAGLRRAPQSPPRMAVRAFYPLISPQWGSPAVTRCRARPDVEDQGAAAPHSNRPTAYSQTALEVGLSARPQSMDLTRGRAELPLPPGPAALRDAFFRCADAMADGFGRDWEREQIERRARAWEQRRRHG